VVLRSHLEDMTQEAQRAKEEKLALEKEQEVRNLQRLALLMMC
jgi:hypothetical protein